MFVEGKRYSPITIFFILCYDKFLTSSLKHEKDTSIIPIWNILFDRSLMGWFSNTISIDYGKQYTNPLLGQTSSKVIVNFSYAKFSHLQAKQVANSTERQICTPTSMASKNLSVCLLVQLTPIISGVAQKNGLKIKVF